jgi:hypothetical protein
MGGESLISLKRLSLERFDILYHEECTCIYNMFVLCRGDIDN